MNLHTMILRHICFTGPQKEAAIIKFGYGLNLIYGPSNTGKSSVLDAIDFMLGREKDLKEIPEHVGYDQIFLGFELSNSEKYTLVRSVSGGDFQCFNGLHLSVPINSKSTILKEKRPTKKNETVSQFILGKIGLNDRKIKKNAQNETDTLSLRTLMQLFLITETNIQKEISPYRTEQYTKQTFERSRLKLLLTGVDDSSLISSKVAEKKLLSRTARIEVLDELVEEQNLRVAKHIVAETTVKDLEEQSILLNQTLTTERNFLHQFESDYTSLLDKRNKMRKIIAESKERIAEIHEMLGRFNLLDQQYETDLLRLEGVSEAGSLISVLPSENCPLCGAEQNDKNKHKECDGNVKTVVTAAFAEISKIEKLRIELGITVDLLKKEEIGLNKSLPSYQSELDVNNQNLSELSPDLSQKRTEYSELLDIRTNIFKSIELLRSLENLKNKIDVIEKEKKVDGFSKDDKNVLPISKLDDLSLKTQLLLQLWKLSNVDRVHFEKESDDFVIGGKKRISNGKGHRSITHAAATLGLMKYLEEENLPSLGFVLLDSPLLAYEKPDDEEDDLSETDVNKHFFNSLRSWNSMQTIIFENKKSIPNSLIIDEQITLFTKNSALGRYGFFPVGS